MKTNNRPTEKYSYRTFDGEHKTELIPISDAKYIEHLEKENQELEQANNLLVEDYNKLKELCDKVDLDNHSLLNEGKQLYKENQELKSKLDFEKFNQKTFNEFYGIDKEYQHQFLKVVESVLVDGGHSFWDITYNGQFKDLCDCGKWNSNMKITYEQHLLQEIKSAMEKGNND